jgi:hypothetical protein
VQLPAGVPHAHKDDGLAQLLTVGEDHVLQHLHLLKRTRAPAGQTAFKYFNLLVATVVAVVSGEGDCVLQQVLKGAWTPAGHMTLENVNWDMSHVTVGDVI